MLQNYSSLESAQALLIRNRGRHPMVSERVWGPDLDPKHGYILRARALLLVANGIRWQGDIRFEG